MDEVVMVNVDPLTFRVLEVNELRERVLPAKRTVVFYLRVI
jgi:hypothetical protein